MSRTAGDAADEWMKNSSMDETTTTRTEDDGYGRVRQGPGIDNSNFVVEVKLARDFFITRGFPQVAVVTILQSFKVKFMN